MISKMVSWDVIRTNRTAKNLTQHEVATWQVSGKLLSTVSESAGKDQLKNGSLIYVMHLELESERA